MSKLIFVPVITEIKLDESSCKMYQTHGSATHEAMTALDEIVLLFPSHDGERLALCYRQNEYGDHEKYADEWNLLDEDLEDCGNDHLSLNTTIGL